MTQVDTPYQLDTALRRYDEWGHRFQMMNGGACFMKILLYKNLEFYGVFL